MSQFRLKENQIDYAQKRKLWEAERTREKELAGEVPFVMEGESIVLCLFLRSVDSPAY